MDCRPNGLPPPLYGLGVTQAELPAFGDRLQALPSSLLSLVLDGLYRPAPQRERSDGGRCRVRAACSDQLEKEGWIVRFVCTARVRLILQEYSCGRGPFFRFPPDSTRWLAEDRFVQRSYGEYWSLGRCLATAGDPPVHRCSLAGETR